MPKILTLMFVLTVALTSYAVPVHINSGNPVFPFPQFLPYVHPNGDALHNLGTHNPAGVVHAEMEKTIRDAYQIMMNRASFHPTATLGGTRYVTFASNPYCSEGYGYALLAAAMMADKNTFDGLWLYIHDYTMNNTHRHIDGAHTSPGYGYSALFSWVNVAGGNNSATDGDVDIAFALMIAHMQWGDNMGINNSSGQPISYKNDLIKVLRGLTDTLTFAQSGSRMSMVSGVVGVDGYIKNGDSWSELTGWSQSPENLLSIGIVRQVETAGPQQGYVDYFSPAYFRQFADFLKREDPAKYAWNIFQFERGEASSDWVYGRHIQQSPNHIPFAGHVNMINDTTPVLSTFNEGEDFRAGWRTVLNYVWHGNPEYTWDPVRRTVIRNRSNTFQKESGERFARFLWDRRQAPWNQGCERILGEGDWWGPSMVRWFYRPDGTQPGTFPLNWVHGTGSPSAVTAQNMDLMAEMYRQAELEWDVETPGDRYLTSVPTYFHGFFRLLGMMTLTGNHHAPLNMKPQANMKVYLDVDKTYAFENDTITYTVNYRNYGSADADNVMITKRLHSDFVFLSSSHPGANYDQSSHTVTWNLGIIPGFKTATGTVPTQGSFSYRIIIPFANQKRYESNVAITCSNGLGWVSNEYPNKISSIMRRNGVDIAQRALRINHTVFRDTVNPGMVALYTINFENSAEAGWLNGGRPGVSFSYAHSGTADVANQHTFQIRIFHDAHEAYIDYGNYRMSYFLSDNNFTNMNQWGINADIAYIPLPETIGHERITPGEDARGRWNQRLIVKIADTQTDTNWSTMAAPIPFLINYHGLDQRVHRGISTPFKAVWRMFPTGYVNRNWSNDWSFNRNAVADVANDAMANWGFPISPDFSDDPAPDNPGKPVTRLHRKLCGPEASVTVDNILIEEWDGYTWRRVAGNGPVPGREVNNVSIRCTIPNGVTFLGFVEPFPFGIAPTLTQTTGGRQVVTWSIPQLLVGQTGRIQYRISADEPAAIVGNTRVISRAYAEADRESPMVDLAILVITRDSLPPPPPEQTTMWKTANREEYAAEDTITYTIAYRQTHGHPVKSSSSSEWQPIAGGPNTVNGTGDLISLGQTDQVNIRHTLSYGTNGMLTGTLTPVPYGSATILFARANTDGTGGVEVSFRREWGGIDVIIRSGGSEHIIPSPFSIDEESGAFDYKIAFSTDSLLLWINDTSAALPSYVYSGITVRAGYAGVRRAPDHGTTTLANWHSHFDPAFNVTIRDTIPWGITYITNSASGQINTGSLAPRQLTPTVTGNAITWSVVSGFENPLGFNDSLTLTWRGVVDTARNRMIVNTAYADVDGYPRDSLGAFEVSRFVTDAPPDTVINPPDTLPLTSLEVRATPGGGIFTGSVTVTLTTLPGASIYYTTNGMIPDPASLATRPYVIGQPLVFTTLTTLRAVAYTAGGSEISEVITHVYEPLRTVPVQSAFFFDTIGTGRAQGVKMLVPENRVSDLSMSAIRRHSDLIEFPGMPAVDTLFLRGDTIVFIFRSTGGIEPLPDARAVISEPPLPDQRYMSVHGYLRGGTVTIIDGVAPVITEAVYSVSPDVDGGGDVLAVTFNKYAALAQTGRITPFVLSYAGGTYELLLDSARTVGNTITFAVIGMTGFNTRPGHTQRSAPTAGDSVRIKVDEGIILNIFAYPQLNPNNNAVPLQIRYPNLEYVLRIGPVPTRDSLNIWVEVEPYRPAVFDSLNPQVRIFDRSGNLVAMTGEKGNLERDAGELYSYKFVWNGRNMNGRRAGTGTYLIYTAMTGFDEQGRKIRIARRRLAFLRRDSRDNRD